MRAVGPYSQAIRHGDLVFCSGALPWTRASGELVHDSLAAEAERCLRNLAAVCEAAGTELAGPCTRPSSPPIWGASAR